eukprot:6857099-Alexandrium_andersonii.AAC.1
MDGVLSAAASGSKRPASGPASASSVGALETVDAEEPAFEQANVDDDDEDDERTARDVELIRIGKDKEIAQMEKFGVFEVVAAEDTVGKSFLTT